MDTYSRFVAHATSRLPQANFQTLTPEDKTTHRRWARAVLAIYSCMFVLGAIGIEANHMMASSKGMGAQTSLRTALRSAN